MTDMEKLVKLLDEFNRDLRPYAGETKYTIWDNHMDLAKYLTDNDVRQIVHAKWIVENETSIRCSECCFNRSSIKMPLNYCPMCGAKMVGV